jgi:hypothetical protein
MDLKILAAVLTTLAAVFIVLNAGGLETSEGTGIQGLIPDFLSSEPPKPETGVNAEITVLTDNSTVSLNGNVTIEGLKTYLSDDVDIKSNNDIEFKNFEGDIRIGNGSKISGTAEGFKSNNVKVARNFRLEKDLNTSRIQVLGVDKASISFNRADIDLEATNSSSGIQETNTSVGIESFSGNMTIRPQEMKLDLEGNISSVEAGQTTFGGN